MFNFLGEDRKHLFQAVGAVLAITVLALGVFWLFGKTSNTSESDVSATLSDSDKLDAEKAAKDFVSKVGNFGVVENSEFLKPENIAMFKDVVRSGQVEISDFVPRDKVYLSAREMTDNRFPAFYDGAAVAAWDKMFEPTYLMSISTSVEKVNFVSGLKKVAVGDSEFVAVDVDVDFSSKVVTRNKLVNDETWDGSFHVRSKLFDDQSVSLVLVKVEDSWKIYSISNASTPFLLASWAKPDFDSVKMSDFQDVEVIKAVLPKK